MSDVGRILGQAGTNISNRFIRMEELRQQEFRNQLSLTELLQRQRVSDLQLANQAEQIGLASQRLNVERLRMLDERTRFRAEEPSREARLAFTESQTALNEARIATETATGDIARRALEGEPDEQKKPSKFREAVSNIFTSLLTPSTVAQESAANIELNPLGQAVAGSATRGIEAIRAATTPLTTTQIQGLQLGFGAQGPTAVADTTAPQEAAVNEVQRATPLFSPPGSDISVEEEEQARAIFEQLAQESREQFEKGLKGGTLKEILIRTAQATANIRRRGL